MDTFVGRSQAFDAAETHAERDHATLLWTAVHHLESFEYF